MTIKWTEGAVIAAIAAHFEWWRHTMCPNVCAGAEMDLCVLTQAGMLWEVEVKVSLADWKADLKKDRRYCRGWAPSRFYYAVPESLLTPLPQPANPYQKWLRWAVPEWVPSHAGVVVLGATDYGIRVLGAARVARPLHRNHAPPEAKDELMRKISFRYWKHVAPTAEGQELEVVA